MYSKTYIYIVYQNLDLYNGIHLVFGIRYEYSFGIRYIYRFWYTVLIEVLLYDIYLGFGIRYKYRFWHTV
jgi:hypothetical protein